MSLSLTSIVELNVCELMCLLGCKADCPSVSSLLSYDKSQASLVEETPREESYDCYRKVFFRECINIFHALVNVELLSKFGSASSVLSSALSML